MSEELVFDTTPRVIPVRIGTNEYELEEATGLAAVQYKNAQTACRVYGPDGNVIALKGLADLEPLLVHLCLHPKGQKGNVPLEVIKGWRAVIQKTLYAKAIEISDLDETRLPIGSAIKKALALPGSPITWVTLAQFVEKVDDEDLQAVKGLFKLTPEELAKNGQTGTTVGSGSLAT